MADPVTAAAAIGAGGSLASGGIQSAGAAADKRHARAAAGTHAQTLNDLVQTQILNDAAQQRFLGGAADFMGGAEGFRNSREEDYGRDFSKQLMSGLFQSGITSNRFQRDLMSDQFRSGIMSDRFQDALYNPNTVGLERSADRQLQRAGGSLDAALASRGIFSGGQAVAQHRQMTGDVMSDLARDINLDQFSRVQAASGDQFQRALAGSQDQFQRAQAGTADQFARVMAGSQDQFARAQAGSADQLSRTMARSDDLFRRQGARSDDQFRRQGATASDLFNRESAAALDALSRDQLASEILSNDVFGYLDRKTGNKTNQGGK